MATLLIAGCGDIGAGLGLEMAAAGHQVYGLKRNVKQLPAPIQGIAADLTCPKQLDGLPEAVDYLVYAVAASRHDAEGYRAAYVDGLRHLLAALAVPPRSVRRLIFVSSTAVYGQHRGEWVDEQSPTEPESFNGRIMREAEQLALNSGYPATVVRFSGIYGPGRERLLNWVRSGVGARAEPVLYGNRIHRDDCIGVLRFLIERDLAGEPVGEVYLASDPDPAPWHEVLEWLRRRLGLPEPARREDFGQRLRTGSKRCRPVRLLAEGYRFRYPSYREGFASFVPEDQPLSNSAARGAK